MIIPGICSITLPDLAAESVIEAVVSAGLGAIEWWGQGHVPLGELSNAKRIGELTREQGLLVAAYGSYYRVGVSGNEGMPFMDILDTADALGAPTIRVWAGNQGFEVATESQRNETIKDSLRIADLAEQRGISITFEFHGGTLTSSNKGAQWFADRVPHSNILFSWQPANGHSFDYRMDGLESLLGRLSTIHVFHWTLGSYGRDVEDALTRALVWPDDFHRHPLSDGASAWRQYLAKAAGSGRSHFALLEFVKSDTLQSMQADAAVLKQLCAGS
ncbi:sugar phosphate isomerase/epimerase family protein [Coraliomargarita sp. W4R72]